MGSIFHQEFSTPIAGTMSLANLAANNGALGTGPVTINGGTLSMFRDNTNSSTANYQLVVPAGKTGTFNVGDRCEVRGTLTGGGTLNYRVPWVRSSMYSNWSAFTGKINIIASTSNTGDLRMSSDYSFPGFPLASVDLGDRTKCYFSGILSSGAGTIIPFGEITGHSGATLQGGPTGGRNFTYRVGAKTPAATEAVFAGTISEQNTSTATTFVKEGAGIWTLTGTGSWNGGTTLVQGTLKITGNMTCKGSSNVPSGAGLILSGGSFSTESLAINSGASLDAYGNLTADLNCDGTYTARGFATGTPGTLGISGSAFFGDLSTLRLRVGPTSDTITTTADLALAGTLNVTLAPGIASGRYRIFTCGGTLDLGTITLTGFPPGTTATLSTSIPGGVDIMIDDSDEDTLPDTWEIANFGNLGQSATDDFDKDGTSNRAEYRLGLNPTSGSSSFRATPGGPPSPGFTLTWPAANGLSFRVERSTSMTESWSSLSTVTTTSAAGSFTDPSPPQGKCFYRVGLLDP